MSDNELVTALPKVKMALRLSEKDFDDQILGLMDAALGDLGIAGVNGVNAVISDSLVRQAVITYCKMNGFCDSSEFDRLKASYDEQKAQLSMATGWTDWGVDNA